MSANMTPTAPLDIKVTLGVELTQAELLPLTRAECIIVASIRRAIQECRNKNHPWMLVLQGSDEGAKIFETKAPRWARWESE
jgi:hypothetical protein